MTRTNKLSIAITSMFLTIAASSAAADPLGATGSVTGAAGIDLGRQAQIAAPLQIQKNELRLASKPERRHTGYAVKRHRIGCSPCASR